jgi:hypothetical protein
METKDEIFDKLLNYLDAAIYAGFFTEDEVEEIHRLEREYYIQEDAK